EPAVNGAGIGLAFADSLKADVLSVAYSNARLNFDKGNVDLLTERLFAVNAENPAEPLQIELLTAGEEGKDSAAVWFSTIAVAGETKAKYALVCFRGIDSSEFVAAATPPCFFIVSLDKKNPHVLTAAPLLGGELVAPAGDTEGKFLRFAEPQVYSGTVDFEKSKNVELQLTVTADAAQVTELQLNADELYLSPKNFTKWNKDTPKLEFRTLEQTSILTSYHSAGLSQVVLKGGVKTATPFATPDAKTVRDDIVTCDLSITDACIYGTVKVILNGCATKQVYAVLRNTTTPQDVPENILEPLKK
ncbi:MAG: hypothetical protein LBS03_08770, partial [Bacteroidales bacterium]|nr:hypothetical protein [Bacteroidales bacterium]